MPSLDGGHYFLTVLAPINNSGVVERNGAKSSPVHMVREALETLPTALQSPATEAIGLNSPFARNTRTHLARFVVLDDVNFNGRNPVDSIVSAALKTDLLTPQPVDHLPSPYLIFVADFDPDASGAAEPRAYLEALWDIMTAELNAVFCYCYGWDKVTDRASFADFIIAREVETTLPFNDYWVGPPQLPSLPLWSLAAAPGLGIVAAVGFGLASHTPWYCAVGLGVLLFVAGLVFDYGLILSWGRKPFPAAPNSTLPHVLKALYLQHAFTRFVIDHQGDDPATLKAGFRTFLAANRPADLAGPTQAAGVIK